MLRWVLAVLAAGLCVAGIYWKLERPFKAKPRALGLEQLGEVLATRRSTQVRLEAATEPSSLLFPTGLRRPAFANCSPGEAFRLREMQWQHMDELVGCVVVLPADLATDKYVLRRQLRRDQEPRGLPGDTEARSRRTTGGRRAASGRQTGSGSEEVRYLIPLRHTQARLWVLSPPLVPRSPEERRWLASDRHEGRLLRMRELETNMPAWFRLAELQDSFKEHRGSAVPKDATLVAAQVGADAAQAVRGRSYVPVRGAGGRLFVEQPVGASGTLPPVLEGKLTPTTGDTALELARAMGQNDTDVVGILRIARPERRSPRQLAAVLTLAAAVLCFVWVMRRAQRAR
ncbi:MAG: hypothetical protein MJD61_04030 [Proteobacteria bacterium]|nr:hypothetical protein [Pseudomonadota bacterium]